MEGASAYACHDLINRLIEELGLSMVDDEIKGWWQEWRKMSKAKSTKAESNAAFRAEKDKNYKITLLKPVDLDLTDNERHKEKVVTPQHVLS